MHDTYPIPVGRQYLLGEQLSQDLKLVTCKQTGKMNIVDMRHWSLLFKEDFFSVEGNSDGILTIKEGEEDQESILYDFRLRERVSGEMAHSIHQAYSHRAGV